MSELLVQDELVVGAVGTADSSTSLRFGRNDKVAVMEIEQEDETPFDKLREECGVMAVYNHPDAARLTYWGLYALQHRGQESAGIATADGQQVNDIKGMGLVSEIFTDEVLAKLPGHIAIGHTRYSTTGDSALLNAQPISVESTKGLIAIAHNGNLVNLGNSKERLERDGAVFQTTSDSEIIIQLIAHSKQSTLVDCIAESLAQVEGAFSIVMMTRNRIFAARDPHGFRPLSMGRIAGVDGAPDTFVFASETCAFDLLHAKYERDVKPGELVMVSEDGVTSRYFSTRTVQASCIFEHVYFARPDSKIYRAVGAAVAGGDGAAAGAGVGCGGGSGCAGAGLGCDCGDWDMRRSRGFRSTLG